MRTSEPSLPAPRAPIALRAVLCSAALLLACRSVERGAVSAHPAADRLRSDIAYLADDRLEGRGTGTAGNDTAAAWLARRHAALGLAALKTDTTPACRASVAPASCLSYLQHFPVDALKIDKSFVDSVASTPQDSALARTIVELGRGMRLETIAEGIESLEQLERLRQLDCQLGQGYHFSRPLEGPELTGYLQRQFADQPARRAA